jgi:hypothetical protein
MAAALPRPGLALLAVMSIRLISRREPLLLLLVVVEGVACKEAMAWARLLASSSSARQNMARAWLLSLLPPDAAGGSVRDAAGPEIGAGWLDMGRGLCAAAAELVGFWPSCWGLQAASGRTFLTGLCMLAVGRLQAASVVVVSLNLGGQEHHADTLLELACGQVARGAVSVVRTATGNTPAVISAALRGVVDCC